MRLTVPSLIHYVCYEICLRYQTVAFYSWIRKITSFAFKTYFVDDSRFDKGCLRYQTVACPNSNSTVGYERLQVLHLRTLCYGLGGMVSFDDLSRCVDYVISQISTLSRQFLFRVFFEWWKVFPFWFFYTLISFQ